MAEVEKWITVNGNHIPVMKGESKMAAVGRFIKGRMEKKRFNGGYGSKEKIAELRKIAKDSEDKWKRTPDKDDRKERNALLTSKESAAIRAAKDKEQVDQALKYRKSLNRTIKGRAKTKEERLDELSDKAADLEMEKDYLYSKGSLREYQNAKIRYEMADKKYEKEKAKPTARYKLKEDKPMTKSEKVIWDNAIKTAKAMADKNTDVNALAERIYNRNIKTKKNDKVYKKAARNDRKRSYGDTSGSRNTYRS